jgi:hypothetical protein
LCIRHNVVAWPYNISNTGVHSLQLQ